MKTAFFNSRRISALLLILALTLTMLLGVSCNKGNVADSGTATVVVAAATEDGKATEYKVNLADLKDQRGLMTVLDYLKEHNGLTYTAQDSEYGAFLTSVNDLKPEGNQYISLYTTVAADADVSEWATTIEYQGTTLTSSGVGASSMTIEDGAVIYICLLTF